MDGQGTGLFSPSKSFYIRLGVLSCIVIVIGLGVFGWTWWFVRNTNPKDFSGSITPAEFEVANNLTTNTPRSTGKAPTPSQTQTKNEMPTRTPTPTRKPTSSPTEDGPWMACEGSYLSRLRVEDRASVSHTPPLANRVRSNPGLGR